MATSTSDAVLTQQARGRGRQGKRRRRHAPRQLPEPVRIESLDAGSGKGVARVDGKVVFVRDALAGELVEVMVTRRRRSHDEGRATRILEASPDRVEPPCHHSDVCGGCSLQHLSLPAQRAARLTDLADKLHRFAGVEPVRWLPEITGPDRHYRIRARLGVKLVTKKGGVLVGFREKDNPYIADMDSCEVLDARVASLLPGLRQHLASLSCAARIPQIEVAASDTVVALTLRHLEPLTDSDRQQLLDFGQAHGVTWYLQPGGLDTVEPLEPEVPTLCYELPVVQGHQDAKTLRLQFGPTDFTQVNPVINRALVDRVLSLLAPEPGQRLLDFFCGIGNFSLPLAVVGASVVGYEGELALVNRATDNARINGLRRVGFTCADLYDQGQLAQLMPQWRGAAGALLDPPRTGALALVKVLATNGPDRLVYVSCNPATLARDAAVLCGEGGYRLEAAGIADMFPHTAHVESVALFVRREGGQT